MRVLVVAPQSNIDNMTDWVASARGHELTVLNKTVTGREVLSCVASGRFEVVHFASHSAEADSGCADALVVSDGEIAEQLLEDAFRAAGSVRLVILGACASVAIGARLYMAGVPRVISWRVNVPDAVAGEWARIFYSSLGLSGDIWDATQTAAERLRARGVEPPIYLNGRMTVIEAELQSLRHKTRLGGAPVWLTAGFFLQLLVTLALLLEVMLR